MTSVLGRLIVELGLDPSNYKDGLGKAGGDLDNFAGKAVKGGAIVGTALTAGGLAAATGLGVAISKAANFEAQIDSVGAVSQASAGQMDQLSDAALRIGKDTAFSAGEAAGAMEILAANGLTVEQILGGAADATVALAAAGGTDLAVAADVASTAMKVWNLEGEQMEDVVNRVAGAANVSRFGVEDMSLAIAQGAGVASAFGVSMEDFTTAIAGTADMFASGSDAGTSFKQMMLRLVNPIGAGKEAIAQYGLEFRDANGKLKDFAGISDELRDKLGGLTDAQREQAMAAIFGSDAIRAATGLYKLGGDAFREMSDTMGNTDAQAIAKQRMDNLNGAIEQLKGSFEVIAIQIGMVFLPILAEAAMWLAEVLPAAFDWLITNAAPVFERWTAVAIETARVLGEVLGPAVTAVIDAVAPLVSKLMENEAVMQSVGIVIATIVVAAFLSLAVAAGAAAVSVLLAVAPFLAIAVAIGALIAVGVLLYQNWDEITARFPKAGEALEQVREKFAAVADWITGTFIPTFMDLAKAVGDAGREAVDFVQRHWDQIQRIIEAALALLVGVIEAQWKLMAALIEGAMLIITGIINVALGLLTGDWGRAWDGIKQILDGAWTIIKGIVQFGIDTVRLTVNEGVELVKSLWALAWDVIKQKVVDIWTGIQSATISALAGLWLTVLGGLNDLKALFAALPGQIMEAVGNLWDMGRKMIQDLIDGLKSIDVGSIARGIGGSIKDGIISGAGKLIGKSPSPLGIEISEDFADGLVLGMQRGRGKLEQAGATALTALSPEPGRATNLGLVIGYEFMDGVNTGIDVRTGRLIGTVENVVDDVSATFDANWDNVVGRTMEGILTGWQDQLVEGLEQGSSMAENTIVTMLSQLSYVIYNGGFDTATRQMMDRALGGMIESLRSGGGVAVAELQALISQMLGIASSGAAAVSAAIGGAGTAPGPGAGGSLATTHWGPQPMAPEREPQIGDVGTPYRNDRGAMSLGPLPPGMAWEMINGQWKVVEAAMLASGGTAMRGGWAVVGDRGPELLHMDRGDTVYDNDELEGLGGRGVVVQQNAPVYIYANDPDGGRAAYDDWTYNLGPALARRGIGAA